MFSMGSLPVWQSESIWFLLNRWKLKVFFFLISCCGVFLNSCPDIVLSFQISKQFFFLLKCTVTHWELASDKIITRALGEVEHFPAFPSLDLVSHCILKRPENKSCVEDEQELNKNRASRWEFIKNNQIMILESCFFFFFFHIQPKNLHKHPLCVETLSCSSFYKYHL